MVVFAKFSSRLAPSIRSRRVPNACNRVSKDSSVSNVPCEQMSSAKIVMQRKRNSGVNLLANSSIRTEIKTVQRQGAARQPCRIPRKVLIDLCMPRCSNSYAVVLYTHFKRPMMSSVIPNETNPANNLVRSTMSNALVRSRHRVIPPCKVGGLQALLLSVDGEAQSSHLLPDQSAMICKTMNCIICSTSLCICKLG